jgi:hypothetical protein
MLKEADPEGTGQLSYDQFQDILRKYRETGGQFCGWGRFKSFQEISTVDDIELALKELYAKVKGDECLWARYRNFDFDYVINQ